MVVTDAVRAQPGLRRPRPRWSYRPHLFIPATQRGNDMGQMKSVIYHTTDGQGSVSVSLRYLEMEHVTDLIQAVFNR